ncbi:YezD family protein [Flavobacteriales bacterium]|jgi:hypothetical protein|nr:YezD family protein [Flavobacteriales bacterium]
MSENKLDILQFKGKFDQALVLYNKFNERVFSKTEIDVVYSDFTNWERNELIDISHKVKKGGHKKLSYVDYVWVSIVKELRGFGFSYDEIKAVKVFLFTNLVHDKEALKELKNHKEYISRKSEGQLDNLDQLDEVDLDQVDWSVNFLEFLMINIMLFAQKTVLQCFKDEPEIVIPLSINLIKDYEQVSATDVFANYITKSHVCISLTYIMSYFIKGGEKSFETGFPHVLSQQEHDVLKAIRHNYQDLKSVNIRFKDNKPQLLEIKMMKKVQVESRILELIKSGEYATIEIKTVDGKLSHYEKTEKIKL